MTFRVGQEVVCIKKGKWRYEGHHYWPRCPSYGEKLTIRSIFICPMTNKLNLRFEEITCGIHDELKIECGFNSERFRPVVKTNIEIFTAMLAPSPSKVTETV